MRRGLGVLGAIALVSGLACSTRTSASRPAPTQSPTGSGVAAGGQLPSWPAVAASVSDALDTSSANICSRGAPACLDVVIDEMTRRFDQRAAACDHAALFALAYIDTSEGLRDAERRTPQPESDAYMRHLDAVFARGYFAAADGFAAGDADSIPRVWQIAFDAAAARQVTGIGDLLLGINAHVSRDLVFALVAVGLTLPDGTSAKTAFDSFDSVIASVEPAALDEMSRRFDPTVKSYDLSAIGMSNTSIGQLYGTWRDEAWTNAERILNAPMATRAEMEASIEASTAARSLTIEGVTQYLPFVNSTTPRDQFCAAHWRG